MKKRTLAELLEMVNEAVQEEARDLMARLQLLRQRFPDLKFEEWEPIQPQRRRRKRKRLVGKRVGKTRGRSPKKTTKPLVESSGTRTRSVVGGEGAGTTSSPAPAVRRGPGRPPGGPPTGPALSIKVRPPQGHAWRKRDDGTFANRANAAAAVQPATGPLPECPCVNAQVEDCQDRAPLGVMLRGTGPATEYFTCKLFEQRPDVAGPLEKRPVAPVPVGRGPRRWGHDCPGCGKQTGNRARYCRECVDKGLVGLDAEGRKLAS